MSKKEEGIRNKEKKDAFNKLARMLRELTKQELITWKVEGDEFVAKLSVHVHEADTDLGKEGVVSVLGIANENDEFVHGYTDKSEINALHNVLRKRYGSEFATDASSTAVSAQS